MRYFDTLPCHLDGMVGKDLTHDEAQLFTDGSDYKQLERG
jgi:hypothetical protein